MVVSAMEGFKGFGARTAGIHSLGEGRDSCSEILLPKHKTVSKWKK